MSDTVATVLILFALQIKKPEFMEQKILNYSISLAFCLLLSLPLQAQNSDISAPPANTPPKKEKKRPKRKCTIRCTMVFLSVLIYGGPEANCLGVTFQQ